MNILKEDQNQHNNEDENRKLICHETNEDMSNNRERVWTSIRGCWFSTKCCLPSFNQNPIMDIRNRLRRPTHDDASKIGYTNNPLVRCQIWLEGTISTRQRKVNTDALQQNLFTFRIKSLFEEMTAYNYRGRLGAAIISSIIKISRKRKSLTLGDTGPPLSIEYALSTIEAPTVNITTKYHDRFHRR